MPSPSTSTTPPSWLYADSPSTFLIHAAGTGGHVTASIPLNSVFKYFSSNSQPPPTGANTQLDSASLGWYVTCALFLRGAMLLHVLECIPHSRTNPLRIMSIYCIYTTFKTVSLSSSNPSFLQLPDDCLHRRCLFLCRHLAPCSSYSTIDARGMVCVYSIPCKKN